MVNCYRNNLDLKDKVLRLYSTHGHTQSLGKLKSCGNLLLNALKTKEPDRKKAIQYHVGKYDVIDKLSNAPSDQRLVSYFDCDTKEAEMELHRLLSP